MTSPRLFWHNRNNSENVPYGGRTTSPSPQRRSSIERLQRASRVRNSNILALEQKQEYDPTRLPTIERPLAKVQQNAFGSAPLLPDFKRSDSSKLSFSMMSPGKLTDSESTPAHSPTRTASKDIASPTKSALSPSKFKDSFDPETGTWSAHTSYHEDDFVGSRSSHRHVKSVTFDAAPPQVNEYEMATPDISSIGTNSREGSYESIEDDDDLDGPFDLGHIHEHEESFDASLEDTDKTPVVGPDDWRADSPAAYHGRNPERFEASPMPEGTPSMAMSGRSPKTTTPDSARSSGEHRPLPPVPGGYTRNQSASPSLSNTAERMLHTPQRNLPTPPPASATKADIQSFGNGKMTLEERLKLMMMSEDNNAKTAAEQQRERRMRRAGGRDRTASPQVEATPEPAAPEEYFEEEDTIADMSALGDFQMPPKISRESIMRRVNGNKTFERQSDYNFSSPAGSPSPKRSPQRSPQRHMPIDPDTPIPSTEDSILEDDTNLPEDESVIITRDSQELQDDVLDMYQDMDHEEIGDQELHEVELTPAPVEEEKQEEPVEPEEPEEPEEPKVAAPPLTANLPDLAPPERPLSNDLESYMSPSADQDVTPSPQGGALPTAPTDAKRPSTPQKRLSKPEYDGTGWGEPDEYDEEPGTPDSVIHHDLEDDFEPKESPTIPEQLATIKASGSKLKTRVSNTPSDLAAMREARRQVSHEVPHVPPIPEKHRNRLSRDASVMQDQIQEEYIARHPSFKNRSLTLDIDMGLSMDQDFERVIEAQKVVFDYSFHKPQVPSPAHSPSQQSLPHCTNPNQMNMEANSSFRPQRGYLMRQNTKLVAASDKDGDEKKVSRSVNNSPIKTDRPQSWTVEPWNGQVRRKSTRGSRPDTTGAVPPLPGQASNALTATTGDDDLATDSGLVDGNERGRLFVKVMGVKDLDLPLPKGKHHCTCTCAQKKKLT